METVTTVWNGSSSSRVPDRSESGTTSGLARFDCSHDASGVCTEDGTKPSNRATATVAGPSVVAPVVPLVGVGDASAEEGDGVGLP